jgi:hypothetical protein
VTALAIRLEYWLIEVGLERGQGYFHGKIFCTGNRIPLLVEYDSAGTDTAVRSRSSRLGRWLSAAGQSSYDAA